MQLFEPAQHKRLIGQAKTIYQRLCAHVATIPEIGRPAPVEFVAGARSTECVVNFGVYTSLAMKKITDADIAQFIPWRITSNEDAHMERIGQFVRISANRPPSEQLTDIPLDPRRRTCESGRFHVGVTGKGQEITMRLDDQDAHLLMGGSTGSGKTTGLTSIILQFALMEGWRVVLLSGKFRDSAQLKDVKNLLGPIATDARGIAAALWWLVQECDARNNSTADFPYRVLVVFDEPQEFTSDKAIASMLGRLGRLGRSAGIHLVLATQEPRQEMFDDKTIRGQVRSGYTIALRAPADISRMIVGASEPGAQHLAGAGDCYAIGRLGWHRAQMYHVPDGLVGHFTGARPDMLEWPPFDPIGLEMLESVDVGEKAADKWQFTADELAAMWAAVKADMSLEDTRHFIREHMSMQNARISALRNLVQEAQGTYEAVFCPSPGKSVSNLAKIPPKTTLSPEGTGDKGE